MQTILKTDVTLFGHKVLGGQSLEVVEGLQDVPLVNPGYQFRLDSLRVVLDYILNGSRLKNGMFLFGPSGTGKTSVVEQVAARIGIPVLAQVGSEELLWSDMVGQYVFTGPGVMGWIDGPLTTAYRDGLIYLLDEIDRMQIPAGFYRVLERKDLILPNGTVVKMHPNFRLFATGNTNGGGDVTGKYRGTVVQNEALMQRFKVLEVGWMDEQTETRVVREFMKEFGWPEIMTDQVAPLMVKAAGFLRGRHSNDPTSTPITIDFSTRTLLSWVEEWAAFHGIDGVLMKEGSSAMLFGLDRAVLARADTPTREAVLQVLADVGLLKSS